MTTPDLTEARRLADHPGALHARSDMLRSLADEVERLRAQVAPAVPTTQMLDAARDWSAAKYGKTIGSDAAAGCWAAMLAAAPAQQAQVFVNCKPGKPTADDAAPAQQAEPVALTLTDEQVQSVIDKWFHFAPDGSEDFIGRMRAALALAASYHPAQGVELDTSDCDECCGKGWNWQHQQVAERKSDTQEFKVDCPACSGLGFVGPDANRSAALAQAPDMQGVELSDQQIEVIRQQDEHHSGSCLDHEFNELSFARAVIAAARAQAPAAQGVEDERAAFERWLSHHSSPLHLYGLGRDENDRYGVAIVQAAWWAWQARAAIAQAPAAEPLTDADIEDVFCQKLGISRVLESTPDTFRAFKWFTRGYRAAIGKA